ncbi:MAG: hypothetical protein JJU33_14140 [Phycisphaerales bacterium]|nr:hypothetical protein [Phycisphaerales bacterium]
MMWGAGQVGAQLLAQVSSQPLAPRWVVLPMAAVTLVVLAAHVMAIRVAPMPDSRRRIRTANGVVMMLLVTVLAYAIGVATPALPGGFTLGWLAAVGLLVVVLGLSLLDMLNTFRLHARETKDTKSKIREAKEELRRILEGKE